MPTNDLPSFLVQIATPFIVGTGFCLNEEGIIVTNEHIVRDSQMVVVDHPTQGRQLGKVIYLDSKRDLALLRVPKSYDFPTIKLQYDKELISGQEVRAFGGVAATEGLIKEGVTQPGIIKEVDHELDGIPYLFHTAILSRSDSGGPLLDSENVLLGVNTFIPKGGVMIGLSLPSPFLKEALEHVKIGEGRTGCRCFNCGSMVYDDNPRGDVCPDCSEEIQLPALIAAYQPVGVAATIESILSETMEEVALSRKGPSCWEVRQGSATIIISYYEKNGLIVGDAHLCALPPEDNEALFSYLLKRNFEIENLTFSIRDGDIVLSLMIYDRYLNESTGRSIFQYLFQQADNFDNILVEQYGALWKVTTKN